MLHALSDDPILESLLASVDERAVDAGLEPLVVWLSGRNINSPTAIILLITAIAGHCAAAAANARRGEDCGDPDCDTCLELPHQLTASDVRGAVVRLIGRWRFLPVGGDVSVASSH